MKIVRPFRLFTGNLMNACVVTVLPFALIGAQQGSAPALAASGLSPASMRADLEAFRKYFVATEASFSPAARIAADQRAARLIAVVDTLHHAYFEVELARIAALADNGHTGIGAAGRARRFNRVPIRMTPFGDGLYVLYARPSDADLLGARLTAINGTAVDSLRAIARTLAGGTTAWRDRGVSMFMESPELLSVFGLATSITTATYHFTLADGKATTRVLTAMPADAAGGGSSNRWMYPSGTSTGSDAWRGLLAIEKAPWSLQDPAARFRWRDAADVDGIVIELRQNFDAPGLPIRRFLSAMDSVLRARAPMNLVLDLRMNGGGDLNTTRDFVQSLPKLVRGRVFVLTSPYTFSAAISTTGYLKQADPGRVSIVGEEVGDRLEFWAEGRPTQLPNSGIAVGHTRERHDYATGCAPYTDCHGNVVRHPIRVKTLAPDIAAPWTITAYRAGVDPGMVAIAASLKR